MENVTVTEVSGGNTDPGNNAASGSRSVKTWVFTLNNYTEDDCTMFSQWSNEVNRMVVSKEVGESGTPHLQGAVTFKCSKRLAGLKKLHSRVHWAIAMAKDCFIYPIKEGSVVFIDVNNRSQGKRNDWLDLKNDIKEGKSYKDMAENHPHLVGQYNRGIKVLAEWLKDDRPVNTIMGYMEHRKVIWLHGQTGAGKTKYIYDNHQYKDVWMSSKNLDWFDGYTGHKVAVFDDFRGSSCSFNWLLRLLDKHPLQVPVKGGFTDWTPEFIYITSCKKPEDVYNKETFDNDEKVEQLLRRITEIKNMSMSELDEFIMGLLE